MTLVSLSSVERSYGDLVVFSGASLRIDERDRIGVVGDNGTGKTTLLRVLGGDDPPDHGERVARRDLTIARVEQIPDLPAGSTVLDAAHASFGELERMEAQLRELEHEMAEKPEDERLAHRHERLHVAFEAGGGYAREREAERALVGLGFGEDAFDKPVDVLSGGEKARVALARAMLRPAELLLLDEPTNHLDLDGIAFLEDWLARRGAAFVVVSHDRRFLDRVCTSIVEVEGAAVTRFKGGFTAYREQKERALETALREFKKQQEFVTKEMAYIRKHMGSRWTAQARGRLKRLRRLEMLAKPKTHEHALSLRLGDTRGLAGQCVIEGEGVTMGFDDTPLFAGLDFRVFHGDRVGILGRNGTGKSTLLKIIAGRLQPRAGRVERAKRLDVAYFSQEMDDLPSSGTVLETLAQMVPGWTEGENRSWLARFLFLAEDVDKDVGTLSGGEKRRLCLARLLVTPADIYLLDEPTNHLDIGTREALEEALDAFPGTVVLVSHDRFFLERAAQRIFELLPDRIAVHEHGIRDYEAQVVERQRARSASQDEAHKTTPRHEPSGAPAPPSDKIRNPWAFQKLEARIFALEEQLSALEERIGSADAWKNPDEMRTLQQRQDELRKEIAPLYEQWENWQ